MKITKLDYLLLLFLALLLAAGLWSYAQACKRAVIVLRTPSPAAAAAVFSETAPMISVPLPADSRESIKLPILMYHGIAGSSTEESEYFIKAERLESDLKWLRDNGYTTILPSQMIAYATNGARLPQKPIILSFDDGYCNNYTYAFPLLQKYQATAVIALMNASGLVEFASHTYNLHHIEKSRKGADRKPGESLEDYTRVLTDDLQRNQDAIAAAIGKPPQVFAWPYGAYPADKSADPILKAVGIRASFTSYQHTSELRRGDADSLLGLGRYLRTPQFDIAKIAENAD